MKMKVYKQLFLFSLLTLFAQNVKSQAIQYSFGGDALPFPNESKYADWSFAKKAGIASLEIFGMETFTTTLLILMPTSITHWEDRYWLYFGQKFKKAWTSPPVWDKDPWIVNYLGHPYQGAVFFNSLRSQNCSFGAAAGFTTFHTFLWEYMIESVMEQPSIQDIIVTPIAGILLGELFHYLTMRWSNNGYTRVEKLGVILLNPSFAINNGFKRKK